MERALLTTREAAEMLGVGASSVKRWADSGVLACVKTPGGHRRFEREALVALREGGLPEDVDGADDGRDDDGDASDEAPAIARGADWLDRWVDALVRPAPREHVQRRLAAERQAAPSWAAVGDELGRVLDELGDRWARGELGVVDEHVASEALARAVAAAADGLPVRAGAPVAVLLTAEGDDHTLGLSLAETVVRERGLASRWLGRGMPVRFAADHVAAGGAALVCVSASVVSRDARLLADQAERLGVACERGGATLVLGGRGAWPARPRFGQRVRTFVELDELLRATARRGAG